MNAHSLLLALVALSACRHAADGPASVPDAAALGENKAVAAQAGPDAASPYVVLYPPGGPPVQVEVDMAVDPADRVRGLMFRRSLQENEGMLFLFPREQVHSFWMKNTYIPLDMIFIRGDMTVAGVAADAVPLTLSGRSIGKPSQHVLEVRGGWAADHGIAEGTPVRFVGVPPVPGR